MNGFRYARSYRERSRQCPVDVLHHVKGVILVCTLPKLSWLNIGCKLVSVFVKNFQTKSNLRKETISVDRVVFKCGSLHVFNIIFLAFWLALWAHLINCQFAAAFP